jgi:hypothetical protein
MRHDGGYMCPKNGYMRVDSERERIDRRRGQERTKEKGGKEERKRKTRTQQESARKSKKNPENRKK